MQKHMQFEDLFTGTVSVKPSFHILIFLGSLPHQELLLTTISKYWETELIFPKSTSYISAGSFEYNLSTNVFLSMTCIAINAEN